MVDVLALQTVWSICVPVAIIETFSRDRTRPWLGKPGLAVTAAVFGAGSVFLALAQIQSEHFTASPAQFAQAAAAIVALIVAAFVVGRRPAPRAEGGAPRPWLVGAAAFAVSSLYWPIILLGLAARALSAPREPHGRRGKFSRKMQPGMAEP